MLLNFWLLSEFGRWLFLGLGSYLETGLLAAHHYWDRDEVLLDGLSEIILRHEELLLRLVMNDLGLDNLLVLQFGTSSSRYFEHIVAQLLIVFRSAPRSSATSFFRARRTSWLLRRRWLHELA